jgi:hypothetical protein
MLPQRKEPMPLNETARAALRDKQLNYSAYGVLTLKQYLERSFADGCRMEPTDVQDEGAMRKAQKEYEYQRNIPLGQNPVPIGNENHPRTIAYRKLERQLKDGITVTEYHLHRPDGRISIINKTGYEYWVELTQNRNRQIEDKLRTAPILDQVPFPKDAEEYECR